MVGEGGKSSLRPQRCVTCHPGAGAQGPNRHGSCTQPRSSRRQGLERDLPSLAAEPQLLPGPPGSLVLSANLQVLCGCLPTCSSRSLWGFSGHPSGVVTRPPDNLAHKATSPAFVYGARFQGNEHQAGWTRIPGTPSGTNIAVGSRTHRQGVLELACSPVSSGDATHMDEIHRLTRVTARGLHLPRQAFNTDTDRGPKGKGRLMRVGGLRRLESPTIERVRRAPARGSGVATTRTRRTTPSSFLA